MVDSGAWRSVTPPSTFNLAPVKKEEQELKKEQERVKRETSVGGTR